MEDVTIVMPAFNEVKFIGKAIGSAIHQAQRVIVCDNDSTDGTKDIYPQFLKYKNFQLIQQPKNMGSVASAKLLFSSVETKYVAVMGAHDILSDNYIATLHHCLENNPDVVLAYAPANRIDEDDAIFDQYFMEDIADGVASDDVFERVLTIIKHLNDCTVVYCLARAEEFLKCLDYTPVAAGDHCVLCELVTHGKFMRCDEARFSRRYLNREETNEAYMKRIQGDSSPNNYQRDLTYMIKRQLEILQSVPCDDESKKASYIAQAKQALIERFDDIERFKIDYAAVVNSVTE